MSNQEYYPEPLIIDIQGKLTWPNLVTVNTKFNDVGTYDANVILPEEEAQKYIDKIDKFYEESLEAMRTHGVIKPKANVKEASRGYADQFDSETGEPTGNIIFKASRLSQGTTKKGTEWTWKPPIFDAKGKPMVGIESIYGGTEAVVRVALTPFYTAALGFGLSSSGKVPSSIKKGLLAVQIIKLVQGGSEEESFGEVEGGYEHEDVETAADEAFEDQSLAEDEDAPETY